MVITIIILSVFLFISVLSEFKSFDNRKEKEKEIEDMQEIINSLDNENVIYKHKINKQQNEYSNLMLGYLNIEKRINNSYQNIEDLEIETKILNRTIGKKRINN